MNERTPVRGGLHLPSSVGVGEQEQKDIHNAWTATIDNVEADLASMGIVAEKAPEFSRPTLTAEQLTTTINKDYTILYSQHLSWYNYTTPLVAKVKARLLGVKNEMTDIEVRIRQEMKKKNKIVERDMKFTEKDIEDHIWMDPRYKQLLLERQRLEQYKLELDAYLETMDRNLLTISRQVEIRKIEYGGNHIENNLPGRGRYQPIRTP